MRNKKGFTLAEVLITLAVIGVVAALTIPTLISSSSEKEAKTSIKKALSVLNQALTLSIAENGTDAGSVNNSADLKTTFANYMSVLSYDNANNAFTGGDGMIYTFYHTNVSACGTTDTSDPNDAECLVEVDIDGNSGSEAPANTSSYSDLYYFVIKDTTVIPSNNSAGTWDPNGTGGFRASSGSVDNVAIDALLN